MRKFDSGATRSNDAGKPDYEGYLSPLVIRRFGEYMLKHQTDEDGNQRASDNWQKGIDIKQYMKSKFRHFVDTWGILRGWWSKTPGGDDLENCLCAELFNTMGLLHELLKAGVVTPEPTSGKPESLPAISECCDFCGTLMIKKTPHSPWECTTCRGKSAL